MATAAAMRCEHLTDGNIPWLLLKPEMCSIGKLRPASYRHICMEVEIASNSPAFFIVVDSLLPTTIDK